MLNKIKNIFSPKQYMFVGKLYKLKQDVGFNCGQPATFKTVPKNTILLLVLKEKREPHGLVVYTLLYDNEFICHVNESRYEKHFARLFDLVEESP